MRKSILFLLVLCSSLVVKQQAKALSIKDSVAFSMPVYVIDWTDNDGKPRKVAMVKDSYAATAGVCVLIKYYDGNTPVSIQSYDPNDASSWNAGFGGTVHHDMTYHNGGTLTLAFQGPHHAIFNWVQTLDGAVETVTYTFLDGLDYFQWQETVDTRAGTLAGDSRGPYCTMKWDGVDFSQVTGQEYGAQKYFSQPSYNGAWTFGGTVDIPYVLQWDNSKEVGYVQTQTFTQQLAGAPNWSGSYNIPASGSTVADADVWMYDFQMNFYDKAKKITWGMPYGYMNGSGDGAAAVKNGWGQYSLSIVFDAQAENGVKRVRDENRVIHNGNVSLTATTGTVVTTGPVGTANPATQTLSPAGYDHNYRTWWAQASGTGIADLTMTVNSGVLKNPTFRIKNMTGLPATVEYNGAAIVSGTDYYASFNASSNEVWLTLKRDVTGSKTIKIVDATPSGITISASSVTPSTVVNNVSNNLTFAVTATDDGSIASIKLDLSPIGGGSAVTMTLASASTYSYAFTMAAGVSTGTKTIVATVTDNLGNQKTENISLTVNANVTYLDIYTDPSSMITGFWNSNGTLAEQTGAGAIEGTKDYLFNFTTVSYYAGFGLNFSNWDDAQAKDFSSYETLEISYSGPTLAGSGFALSLTGAGTNNNSAVYNLSSVGSYTTVQIPLTAFGSFDLTKVIGMSFSVTGVQASSSSFRIDNMRLSKQNSVSNSEIDVKVASTSIASAGSYNFNSVVSGNTGTAVTFTVANTGSAALTLSGTPKVFISGTNASEFTIVQSSLAGSIASGASSTFTITFAPTSVDSKTATISIVNNDTDESSYVINLTATSTAAAAPEINVKAASTSIASAGTYNFSSVLEGNSGTAVTFTIENTGTATMTLFGAPRIALSGTNASDFTVSQPSVATTIAPSGNTTFTITFTPASAGSKSAVITMTSDDTDEGTYTINLTGTATAAIPEINVKAAATSVASAGTYNFSSVLAGNSGTAVTFTIENTGTGTLTLFGAPRIALSGTNASDFTVNQPSVATTIAPSGNTTFTITFTPASAGSKSAVITMTSDDTDEGTYTINLTGTATAAIPEINVKAAATSVASVGTYNFSSVLAGNSGTAVTFTIENTGTGTLTLFGAPRIALSGTNASDFTVSQPSVAATIAPSGNTSFTITFTPASAGSKSAVITMTSDDTDEGTYTINLTGTATSPAPEINVKATSTSVASAGTYNFTSVTAGTSGTVVTFTIENTGTAALGLSGSPIVAISGTNASEFTINQTATLSSISASGSTTFTIVFSPTTSGSKSATISIANDDANENPYTIALTGTALVPTGISEAQNGNIKIYPNPAGNLIHISAEGKNISTLTLRNHLGVLVRELKSENGSGLTETSMELTELPSGIYYLELDSPEGKIVRKIVKQ